MNRPDRFYMNNCKIAQELYKKKIPAMKKQRVDVGNGCLVSYAVKTGSSMTWLEKLLCDAVYTLWLTRRFERQGILRGTVTITVTELLACMSGSGTIRIRQAEPGSISKEQRLADSLERLGQMDIAIWWEEEIERRRLTDVPEVLAESFFRSGGSVVQTGFIWIWTGGCRCMNMPPPSTRSSGSPWSF